MCDTVFGSTLGIRSIDCGFDVAKRSTTLELLLAQTCLWIGLVCVEFGFRWEANDRSNDALVPYGASCKAGLNGFRNEHPAASCREVIPLKFTLTAVSRRPRAMHGTALLILHFALTPTNIQTIWIRPARNFQKKIDGHNQWKIIITDYYYLCIYFAPLSNDQASIVIKGLGHGPYEDAR